MQKYVRVASRIAFAYALSGVVCTPLAAADLGGYRGYPEGRGGIYVPSYYTWTGPYIGAHLGYSWGTSTTDADASGFNGIVNSLTVSPWGWLGGGQFGYNWQNDSFVFGLEGDIGFIGADDSKTTATVFAKTEYGPYGTATARIGFSDNRWLFYAKGGLAVVSITNEAGALNDNTDFTKNDDVRFGWTAGAGIEFAFQPNWSMKVEYLFMSFGDDKSTNIDGDVFTHDDSLHTIKVGVNYRWQPDYVPLK